MNRLDQHDPGEQIIEQVADELAEQFVAELAEKLLRKIRRGDPIPVTEIMFCPCGCGAVVIKEGLRVFGNEGRAMQPGIQVAVPDKTARYYIQQLDEVSQLFKWVEVDFPERARVNHMPAIRDVEIRIQMQDSQLGNVLRNNAIVANIFEMYRRGEFEYQEALEKCVVALAEQVEGLTQRLSAWTGTYASAPLKPITLSSIREAAKAMAADARPPDVSFSLATAGLSPSPDQEFYIADDFETEVAKVPARQGMSEIAANDSVEAAIAAGNITIGQFQEPWAFANPRFEQLKALLRKWLPNDAITFTRESFDLSRCPVVIVNAMTFDLPDNFDPNTKAREIIAKVRGQSTVVQTNIQPARLKGPGCADCKFTGEYRGLNEVRPCPTCSPAVPWPA